MPGFRWAVGITTAPRKGPTLYTTLASLALAGFDGSRGTGPQVFAEPGCERLPRDTEDILEMLGGDLHANPRRFGPWPNFRYALASLLEASPDADCYAIFQDDIELAAGLRGWLDANLWPVDVNSIGVVSLYTAAILAKKSGRGWHELTVDQLPRRAYGALGMVFPAQAARLLHASDRRAGSNTKADFWVGKWCLEADLSYWLHSPSFIKHTGNSMHGSRSSLAADGDRELPPEAELKFRQCAEFCADVDALIEN